MVEHGIAAKSASACVRAGLFCCCRCAVNINLGFLLCSLYLHCTEFCDLDLKYTVLDDKLAKKQTNIPVPLVLIAVSNKWNQV